MSERRQPGDIVAIAPGSGFTTPSTEPRRYQIQPDGCEPWCWHECGDDNCQEWATLWHIDANGVPSGAVAFHVCECDMTSDPANPTPDPAQ